jgi:hypothetical protein
MLRQLEFKSSNLRSRTSTATTYNRFMDYLGWVTEAEQTLQTQIRRADLDSLVFTRKCEILMSMIGRVDVERTYDAPGVNTLINAELEERAADFAQAHRRLKQHTERWSKVGVLVILDTNVYLHHPDEVQKLDFNRLLDVRGYNIHIVVPMIVLDQLDDQKQGKDKAVRNRARRTLKKIDEVLPDPTGIGVLRKADSSALQVGGIPRGEVTIELLFDPPRHERLPIDDDEIVDRIVAFQPLAQGAITLVTYDTGHATRARAAGIRVRKLAHELDDEGG